MNIHNAEFLKSAVFPDDYPEWDNDEIVLLGRSNVGKSTFINKFCNRKKLAYTSSKPGKTQTLNFFYLTDELAFVDVPGYGYAKVSKVMRQEFGEMIERYLLNRDNLVFAILLVDFKVGPTEDDILMYEYLKFNQIKTLIVATKKDKVKNSAWVKQEKHVKSQLDLAPTDMFFAYSAERDKDMSRVHDIVDNLLNPGDIDG